MKIFPYAIALVLSTAISSLLSFPVSFIVHWFNAWLYKESPGFWTGLWLGGFESLILVLFASWVFSWFGHVLPVFFIICISLMILLNNYNRYNTRPNKPKELGYLIGEAGGIPIVYFHFIKEFSESSFIFW
jgi:hypothetical protein